MTPWTWAHQAPLSMDFSRQGYWSGLPFPSSGNLPDPGIKPRSSALQVDSLPSELAGKPLNHNLYTTNISTQYFTPYSFIEPEALLLDWLLDIYLRIFHGHLAINIYKLHFHLLFLMYSYSESWLETPSYPIEKTDTHFRLFPLFNSINFLKEILQIHSTYKSLLIH